MPNWKFHNKWAAMLSIPPAVCYWVNAREERWKVDVSATKDKRLQGLMLSFPDCPPEYEELSRKGPEYIKAGVLHSWLDVLEDICEDLGNTNINEFKEGVDLYEVAYNLFSLRCVNLYSDEYTQFFSRNIRGMIEEIPVPYFHMNRDCLVRQRQNT